MERGGPRNVPARPVERGGARNESGELSGPTRTVDFKGGTAAAAAAEEEEEEEAMVTASASSLCCCHLTRIADFASACRLEDLRRVTQPPPPE